MHHQRIRILTSLLIFHLFIFSLSAQDSRIVPNCPMNVIIAVDFSGSEMEYLDEIRTVLLGLTNPFELDEAKMKIGLITFNRGAKLVLPLTDDTEKMIATIKKMNLVRMVYATDIHSAIDLANKEFRRNSKQGVPKYFILVSDGDPHAHSRGYGWQTDLVNMKRLKAGDKEKEVDPVHVFTLYTGSMSPQTSRFGETVRKASIRHMGKMASDMHSFFYFEDYPILLEYLLKISNCL